MDNDCLVRSGGVYGMQDMSIETGEGTDRTSPKRKMSLKEYQKQRGVRSYDMTTELGRKNKAQAHVDVKALEIALAEQSSRINNDEKEQFKTDGGTTSVSFSISKTGKKTGRISLNPQITSRTGKQMRTSEDKHSFIKNLLCKTASIESSLDMTHHNKMKIVEETDVTHHSVNPRLHLYSR